MEDKGLLYWLNPQTGELNPAYGRFISDTQKTALAKKNQKASAMRSDRLNFVWFLFNYGEKIFQENQLSAPTIARLFYTATYCNYDGKLSSGNHIITKDLLQKKLKLSDRVFYDFWKEVNEAELLLQNDDGSISINQNYFIKGKMKDSAQSNFTRLYCKFVRNMYDNTPVRDHRLLSYFFRLIPYTNFKYNCVCENPTQADRNLIVPMTVKRYCEKLDYRSKDAKRLLQSMLEFKINGQYLISLCGHSLNINDHLIFVNPRLFCSDSSMQELCIEFDACIESSGNHPELASSFDNSFIYSCGKTIKDVFAYFSVTTQDQQKILAVLTPMGYSELNMCYAAAIDKDRLSGLAGTDKFANAFINSVKFNVHLHAQ